MSEVVEWLMAIAVAISSVSLLISGVATVATFRAAKKLRDDFAPLVPQIRETLKCAKQAIGTCVTDVRSLSAEGHVVFCRIKEEIRQIDAARTGLTEQVKIHRQRLEMVTEDILGRTREVADILHRSVRHAREVYGIVAGVRVVFKAFIVGRV